MFFIAVFNPSVFCAISKFLYTHNVCSLSFPLNRIVFDLTKINEGGDEKQKIKLVWPNPGVAQLVLICIFNFTNKVHNGQTDLAITPAITTVPAQAVRRSCLSVSCLSLS